LPHYRLGLDLGSTAAKAVLLAPDDTILETVLDDSGQPPAAVAAAIAAALRRQYGLDDLSAVATGYGRALAEMASRKVTEITCHARGVRHLHRDARTILDIGGQDAKAIRLSPDGNVEDFAMNDRCAAGTGSFLAVAARRHQVDIGDLSAFCGDTPDSGPGAAGFEISSTCVVFAESELISLNARGIPPREALRAVHRAIARRVALLLKQVGAAEPLYFTGGVARNAAMRRALSAATGLDVRPAELAQFAGALGAALFA
jgi:predicted CoA-substrate-specific enzyme activase